jgi:hypothetical protein
MPVRVLLLLLLLVAVFVGAILIASETGGEVVVVTTRDESGREFETSLWVVDHRGSAYLRAGDKESSWCQRLLARPAIKMLRRDSVGYYRAVPEPESTGQIEALMARDYGWADQLIGLIRDPGKSVAIRLERLTEQDY